MIPAELVRIEQENDTTYTFWLKPGQAIDYTAGQFIEIYIRHDADYRGTHRWFTLSSSPSEEYIAITTRKVAKMSSFKQRLFDTRPGDTLQISQAMGDFVLPMQASIPLIFIVRGIGITPVRSMTKQLLDQGSNNRNISIIHSVKNDRDVLFKEIYQKVAAQVIVQTESTEQSVNDAVSQTQLLYNQKPNARIYISGPEQFSEQVYASLTKLGIRPASLVTDYFHGYNA